MFLVNGRAVSVMVVMVQLCNAETIQVDDSPAAKRGQAFVKYGIPALMSLLALVAWYIFAWRPIFKHTPGADFEVSASCRSLTLSFLF